MAKVQKLKDYQNTDIYPVTHERAVVDSNGKKLESKISHMEIAEEIAEGGSLYRPVVVDQSEYSKGSYYINSGTGKWSSSTSGKHIMLDVSKVKYMKVEANAGNSAFVIFVSSFALGKAGATAPTVGAPFILSAGETGYAKIPEGAVGAAVTYGSSNETYGYANKPQSITLYFSTAEETNNEFTDGDLITIQPMYDLNARIADSTIYSEGVNTMLFPVKQGDLVMADFTFTGSTIRQGFVEKPPAVSTHTYSYDERTIPQTYHYSNISPIDGYFFLCENYASCEFTEVLVRVKNNYLGGVSQKVAKCEKDNNDLFKYISPFEEINIAEVSKRKYMLGLDGTFHSDSARHIVIPVSPGGKIKVVKNSERNYASIGWFTEKGTLGSTVPAPLVPNTYRIDVRDEEGGIFDVPEGANYCYVMTLYSDANYTPSYLGYAKPLSEATPISPEDNSPTIFRFNPQAEYEPLMLALKRAHYYGGFFTAPTTLAWFSDVHGDKVATQNVLMWAEKYGAHIDDIIATGDQAQTHFYQNFDWWADTGANNALQVIGNHDAWATASQFKSSDYPGLTFQDMTDGEYGSTGNYLIKTRYVYDKYFAPFVTGWNVVQPEGAAENGLCYYYKDYPAIRLIVLDMMHCARGEDWDGESRASSAQLAWFTSVLEDARLNNKPVVVATHMSPAFAIEYTVIGCKYNTTSFAGNTTTTDSTKFAYRYVNDFIDAGGEFVCWLVGHSHNDKIYTIQTGTNHEQFVVCLTCASARNPSSIARGTAGIRVVGTKTEDAFNVISFDTARKLIKLVRVGQSINDKMERYQQLSYRYADTVDDYNNPMPKGLVSCD